MPIVYGQLRSIAGNYLRSEDLPHTLGATAVVHEAFIKLVQADVGWQDRAHFMAIAARVMRRILVDHARTNRRAKRGGPVERLPLDEALAISEATVHRELKLAKAWLRHELAQ